MKRWRNGLRRLWGKYTIVGLLAVLLVLSGCSRGAMRHESWPGLAVHETTIYAANLEQVQALNAETGKLYWSYPTTADKNIGPFYSTPVLASEYDEYGLLIAAGFKDRKVYALRLGESPAEIPDLVWTYPPTDPETLGESSLKYGAAGQYVGAGVLADDLFIIGNGDGKVYALDVETGKPVWAFSTNDRVWATPVVQDDVVYIASLDHHLYAVDLTTGDELWQVGLQGSIASTPIIANGALWVGDFAQDFYRIDLETHSAESVLKTNGWIWATPVLQDNIVYLADISGWVYAFNIDTQTQIWDDPAVIEDTVHSSPVLNAEGDALLVAGYEKGAIWRIDTERGSIARWGVEQQNPGRLPGDLVTDGERLYAMPTWVTERIQAFYMDGSESWIYPPDARQ